MMLIFKLPEDLIRLYPGVALKCFNHYVVRICLANVEDAISKQKKYCIFLVDVYQLIRAGLYDVFYQRVTRCSTLYTNKKALYKSALP